MTIEERNALMAEIVDKFSDTIRTIAYKSNPMYWEDIQQEAFIKIMANLDNFDDSKSSIKTYVSTVTSSVCRDYAKNMSNSFHGDMVSLTDFEDEEGEVNQEFMLDPTSDPLDFLVAKEAEASLRKGLDSLPDKQHEAFVLRELEGMTYEDVAELMCISESSARTHVARAADKLKEITEGL